MQVASAYASLLATLPSLGGISIEPCLSEAFPAPVKPYVGLPSTEWNVEFVYFLIDRRGSLLYIGRSWRPRDRFTKHRRKTWWRKVGFLALLRVTGDDRKQAEVNTANVEAAAIRMFSPTYNIAKPKGGY